MGEPCGMPRRFLSRLGRACPAPSIVGFFNGAVQPDLDQMQHAPIDDPARHRLEQVGMGQVGMGQVGMGQVGMGNAPEVVREVAVHHFPMAAKHQLLHLDHPLLAGC
jgi:hypothetical protein